MLFKKSHVKQALTPPKKKINPQFYGPASVAVFSETMLSFYICNK